MRESGGKCRREKEERSTSTPKPDVRLNEVRIARMTHRIKAGIKERMGE